MILHSLSKSNTNSIGLHKLLASFRYVCLLRLAIFTHVLGKECSQYYFPFQSIFICSKCPEIGLHIKGFSIASRTTRLRPALASRTVFSDCVVFYGDKRKAQAKVSQAPFNYAELATATIVWGPSGMANSPVTLMEGNDVAGRFPGSLHNEGSFTAHKLK